MDSASVMLDSSRIAKMTTGGWQQVKLYGSGVYCWDRTGNLEVGQWQQDKYYGRPDSSYLDGARFENMYVDDQNHDQKVCYWPNGDRWVRQWCHSEKHGEMVHFSALFLAVDPSDNSESVYKPF